MLERTKVLYTPKYWHIIYLLFTLTYKLVFVVSGKDPWYAMQVELSSWPEPFYASTHQIVFRSFNADIWQHKLFLMVSWYPRIDVCIWVSDIKSYSSSVSVNGCLYLGFWHQKLFFIGICESMFEFGFLTTKVILHRYLWIDVLCWHLTI